MTVISFLVQLVFFFCSYLQPVVENCRQIIGSHAPIIDWAETAQLKEHDIMFTFDIEALYPRIQVRPGVDGLCLFDVVEREIRDIHSPQPDRVEFLVRLLHLVLSTKLTYYGGSFFEVHLRFVHWSSMRKRIGRSLSGCARFTCVAEFRRCSQVSRP